jgi:DNA-binding FrmR family transcriptional regulator
MGYANKKKSTPATRGVASAAVSGKAQTAAPQRHPEQQAIMHRLRRVEGQIRGVLQMMEQDQPCDAVAQQLSAARKALDRAFYEMMACALASELGESLTDSMIRNRIAEKTRLIAKYA